MLLDLTGKTALVTGGSRGLGKAVARRFAQSGARVAILARDSAVLEAATEEITAAGGRPALGLTCDVTREEDIERAVSLIIKEFGRVDILVNNAGSSSRRPFLELTRADLSADMNLKLFAALRISQLVVPGMQQQRWGRIINVATVNAKAPKAASAPTTLTRAAGLTLTKVLSQELAAYNILVNALCVGVIKSNQWEKRHRNTAPHLSFEEFLEPTARTVPLGRLGEAEEFANVACFLASDAASYITGTAINVDGGLSPVL